ncbi:DUF3040 domain-containing protein [Catellatospora sp. NPDC049609]|uniref:DUF3040 domain-containing protein n=1 Tax=Catellatospora sp. NPDC049609 TaxID=3155505 RepID=UPI00343917A3
MELDPEEQRRLSELEARTSAEDPWFALGLRAGEPLPPAEYRRERSGLRIGLSLVASAIAVGLFLAGVPCGGFAAALGAVLALVTAGDRLSGPPTPPPPPQRPTSRP